MDDFDEDRWNEERRKEQREVMLSNFGVRQRSAGIPERYREKTFSPTWLLTDAHTGAMVIVEQYAKNFPKHSQNGECLVMAGNVGTGKTHAACLVANYVLKNRLSVSYHTELSLAQWVREKNWESRDRITQISEIDLLVIDEVGLVNLDDKDRGVITEVINARYNNCGSMIIASNAPFTSDNKFNLKSVLGDRVVDRLKEMGGPRLVFKWDSLRG